MFGIIHDWDHCRYTHVEIVIGMRKILGQLTLDWPVFRLWLVIVGDAGATGGGAPTLTVTLSRYFPQLRPPL